METATLSFIIYSDYDRISIGVAISPILAHEQNTNSVFVCVIKSVSNRQCFQVPDFDKRIFRIYSNEFTGITGVIPAKFRYQNRSFYISVSQVIYFVNVSNPICLYQFYFVNIFF